MSVALTLGPDNVSGETGGSGEGGNVRMRKGRAGCLPGRSAAEAQLRRPATVVAAQKSESEDGRTSLGSLL